MNAGLISHSNSLGAWYALNARHFQATAQQSFASVKGETASGRARSRERDSRIDNKWMNIKMCAADENEANNFSDAFKFK